MHSIKLFTNTIDITLANFIANLAYSMNVMTSHVIEKQKCLY